VSVRVAEGVDPVTAATDVSETAGDVDEDGAPATDESAGAELAVSLGGDPPGACVVEVPESLAVSENTTGMAPRTSAESAFEAGRPVPGPADAGSPCRAPRGAHPTVKAITARQVRANRIRLGVNPYLRSRHRTTKPGRPQAPDPAGTAGARSGEDSCGTGADRSARRARLPSRRMPGVSMIPPPPLSRSTRTSLVVWQPFPVLRLIGAVRSQAAVGPSTSAPSRPASSFWMSVDFPTPLFQIRMLTRPVSSSRSSSIPSPLSADVRTMRYPAA